MPDSLAVFGEGFATHELERRPVRLPDLEVENQALAALARETAVDPGNLMRKLVNTALWACRADSASLSLVERSGSHATIRCPAFAGILARTPESDLPLAATPSGAVLARGGVQLLRDVATSFPGTHPVAPPIVEALVAPFYVDGLPAGTLWVSAHTAHRLFDLEDARLLASLAQFAAVGCRIACSRRSAIAAQERFNASQEALQREIHGRQRAEQAAAVMRRLQEASTRLRQDCDVYTLCAQFLDTAVAIASSDGGAMRMLDPESGKLRLLVSNGLGEPMDSLLQDVDADSDSPWAEALRTGERVTVDDIGACGTEAGDSERSGDSGYSALRRAGMRAVQATPLVSRTGRVLGVISTHWRSPHRPSEFELQLIDVLARQAADLIERRKAEDDVRESAKHQAFLLAVSDRVRALTDPYEILRTATAMLGRRLGVAAVFYSVEDDDETVRVAAAYGDIRSCAASPDRRVPLADLGVGWHEALRSGEAIFSEDHANDSRAIFGHIGRRFGLNAGSAIPLIRGGRLVGILICGHSQVRPWTEDERRLQREVAERTWDAVERARAEAALREIDRRKDEFLATLAHELRNPLMPIQSGLELLWIGGDAPATREKVIDVLQRQTAHLARLVDDLVDMSRITRGDMEIHKERILLADVIQSAVETSRHLIERGKHQLTVSLPSESLTVEADPTRLGQAVSNLLNNAAVYSEPGGRIALSVKRQGDRIVITVKDSGIGIEKEMLSHIFEMFRRGKAPISGSKSGLGIGLTLVRKIVALHGGTVEAKSDGLGKGSEFTVYLPWTPAPHELRSGEESPLPGPGRGRRVLLVDDNRDLADTLGLLLESVGVDVQVVYDGHSALKALERRVPDVIFLDIGMPQLSGLEVAKRIRETPRYNAVKLVALTGWGEDEDRRRSREAGFDHHIIKPVDIDELQALLESL